MRKKDNYERYGLVFHKDYIFQKGEKDVISVDKKFGFVYPEPDEIIYSTIIMPNGEEKTVYYYPNEDNEYCDIIPLDYLPKKKSKIDEKNKERYC